MRNFVSRQPLRTRHPGDPSSLQVDSEGRLVSTQENNFSSPSGANPVYLEPAPGEAGVVNVSITVQRNEILADDNPVMKVISVGRGAILYLGIGSSTFFTNNAANYQLNLLQPLFCVLRPVGFGEPTIYSSEIRSLPFHVDFGTYGIPFSTLSVSLLGAESSVPRSYFPDVFYVTAGVKS